MRIPRKAKTLPLSLLLLLAAPLSASADGSFQTAEAIDLASGTLAAGGATLTRDADSIHLRVALSGLRRKAVYSVWFLVWNSPGDCLSPNAFGGFCLPPPAGGLDAPDAVRNAAGFISGADGTANFSAWLDVGELPDELPVGGTLDNGEGSEIHIVVQTHGRAVAGEVSGQMSIPGFMCNASPRVCENADQFGFVFPPPPEPEP